MAKNWQAREAKLRRVPVKLTDDERDDLASLAIRMKNRRQIEEFGGRLLLWAMEQAKGGKVPTDILRPVARSPRAPRHKQP